MSYIIIKIKHLFFCLQLFNLQSVTTQVKYYLCSTDAYQPELNKNGAILQRLFF